MLEGVRFIIPQAGKKYHPFSSTICGMAAGAILIKRKKAHRMAGLLHRVRYTGSECDGLKLFQALLTHVLPPKLRYAPAAVAENAVGPEFSQDNGCAVHVDLQRITLGNIQRAPQLYGRTMRPNSSTLLTIPVAFTVISPSLLLNFSVSVGFVYIMP